MSTEVRRGQRTHYDHAANQDRGDDIPGLGALQRTPDARARSSARAFGFHRKFGHENCLFRLVIGCIHLTNPKNRGERTSEISLRGVI